MPLVGALSQKHLELAQAHAVGLRSSSLDRPSHPSAPFDAYFITLSVKIAIDFTPPARLRSMASIAAA